MFEALMVPLLVPEQTWAPRSWGVNHPLYVTAQIEHGQDEAHYGYWGFSPSNNPDGGYREYGVDPIGLNPDGYASDQERTLVDYGFGDCRPPQPKPTSYGRGVVTPHASFLALDFERRAKLANLAKLKRKFDGYGQGAASTTRSTWSTGKGLAFLPRARPGDGHGRDRQRADPRPAAVVFHEGRRRPSSSRSSPGRSSSRERWR